MKKCKSDFFHLVCSINYYSSRVFLRKGNYGCDNQQRISPYLLNKFFSTKNIKIIFLLYEWHNELSKNYFYHVFLLLPIQKCCLKMFAYFFNFVSKKPTAKYLLSFDFFTLSIGKDVNQHF